MPLTTFSFYSSAAPVVASSSSANHQFGIVARIVRIQNIGATDMWVRFSAINPGTTGIATSADCLSRACSDASFTFPVGMTPIAMSIMTTTTAAGTSHRNVTVFGEA